MKTDFEQWLGARFAETGLFTIFILLVRITSSSAVPLRSSFAHLVGKGGICGSRRPRHD